jgi:hypothetical protein
MIEAPERHKEITTMARLRKVRDVLKRAEALRAQRRALCKTAIEEGHSQRAVAVAAGLTPGRIGQFGAEMKHGLQKLKAERNDLVHSALAAGHSIRKVAGSAGLSPSRVHEIKTEVVR